MQGRPHRLIAHAAVDTTGIKPERRQAALDFLELRNGRRALATRKFRREFRRAENAVAEVQERECVAVDRIIGADGGKVRSEKEAGPAALRHPQLRSRIELREWLSVCTDDAGLAPGLVGA